MRISSALQLNGVPIFIRIYFFFQTLFDKEKKVLSLYRKKKDSTMNTEKIKVPVKQALPMIAEMVKLKYVTDALGKSSGWIYNKLNHENTTSKSSGFNQTDVNKLNELFCEIGEKLINTRIYIPSGQDKDALTVRQEIIGQIQSVSDMVSMPYIYIGKMKKNTSWYLNRMRKNSTKASFKQEDINMINLSLIEIGNKLLSIELTL